MKTSFYSISKAFVGTLLVSILIGCSAENPFLSESGEGTLRLKTVVNSTVTRAYEYDETKTLKENCVIYISDLTDGKGPLYKFRGLENVPDELKLQTGHYVAEAWTGDSVAASWDKKFYRGYETFDIEKNSVTQVAVNCKIRNVVVAVNQETIDPNLMKDDYTITVGNSKDELVFTSENVETGNAYFMMPDGEKELAYTIAGTRKDGKPFSKTGVIENVESAHKYILNFKYDPDVDDEELGGAFITIRIDDEEIPDVQDVPIYSAPSITGYIAGDENAVNLEKQQVYTDGNIPEMVVKICGFCKPSDSEPNDKLKSIIVATDDYSNLGLPDDEIDLLRATPACVAQTEAAGLTWESSYKSETNIVTYYLTFNSEMLSNLPTSTTEHVINIKAVDNYGKSSMAKLRIANTEDAIVVEDPIEIEPVSSDDWQNVKAHSLKLTFSLADEEGSTPGVEYRVKDSGSEWTFVPVNGAANAPRRAPLKANRKYTVTISGLTAGTTYEYRGCAKRSSGEDFHGESMFVSTESTFTIPNSSFEDWDTYSATSAIGLPINVIIPWNVGNKSISFWGSGNEGAATAGKTLTNKSTDMVNNGTYSAKLQSDEAAGVIAAGNIFVGEYVKTDGTNGVLSVGREYDGSHPTALSVYANYRPASGVKVKSGNEGFVPSGFDGGKDHGQIYVALTTEAVEIRTNPKNRKLFSKDDPVVVAYGQVSWAGVNFGPDGALEKVEIPLEYKSNALTTKPTHLVIVCSASKYGDYFSGAAGSTMYLDDFELVYE